jgi:tetratricopeptide (TPR) repeat protein
LIAATASAQPPSTVAADAQYQEARRLFDALDYDKAVGALDQAIVALQAITPRDVSTRDKLASAYEMRARSKFGLGDQDGTKADFVALLKLDPAHTLSGQVSPRVVALFEETLKDMVTSLTLSVTPATAKVEIDGMPVVAPGTIRIGVGDHTVSAEQPGYRGAKQSVTAVAGATAEIALTLERVSSVLKIVTVPADVEVKVDGKSVGKTVAEGGAAPADAGRPAASATPSAALVVSDVATGPHVVEFARDCYVKVSNRLDVDKPDDYPMGPVTLQPALATLSVKANQPGAQVFVDGKDRGVVPFMMADLCEGEHLVELRSKFGRDARRISARTGAEVSVDGVLKPAFVIVSTSGPANIPQDMRLIVERAFAPSQSVALMAAPPEQADKALKANQLTNDWLAIDVEGRPVGASAQMAGPIRKDASEKLADAFGAQGVASVTVIDPSRVVVALLAAGSATPDVVDVALDNQQSIGAAIAKLDRKVALTKPAIGVTAVDIADIPGVVVVAVDAAAGAGAIKPGDVIVQADGQPIADGAALEKIVAAHKAGDPVALDLKDAAGAAKKAELTVFLTPRLIGLSEHGLLVNRILLDLRARLADAGDAFEQSVIRLNTAVALARIGDWNAAKAELAQVKLPDRPGVNNGTVQYLLGICTDALGQRADAEAALKAAAATDSLLTEDGPSVKELAEARLAEMQRAPR